MSEKPRQRRSFRNIKRFFIIVFALIIVFWTSFFITLAVRSTHPVDYLFSYVEDFFSGDDNKKTPTPTATTTERKSTRDKPSTMEERNSNDTRTPSSYDRKTYDEDRTPARDSKTSVVPVNNTDVGIADRVGRIFSIEDAVDAHVKAIPHYVKLNDIPRTLRQAIVAVEDARFYSHDGFDLMGIARATVVNAEAGQIEEGASTITQQLAKNLFLSSEPSFSRKAEELVLSMNLERHFSKDEIIEMYLNTIYFGSNFYGIYAASKGYFGKEPKDLTIGEATMLAGLPNAPSLYSPYVDFMLAKKRQLVVINAMTRANFLTEKEAENARIEEIVLARNF